MNLNITYWGFGPLLAKTTASTDLLTFLMVEGQKLKKEANTRLAGHIEKEFEYERNHQDLISNKSTFAHLSARRICS